MPKILESVARRIRAKSRRKGATPIDKSSSFAIATEALQRAGHLKKGTAKLTAKGRKWRPKGPRKRRTSR